MPIGVSRSSGWVPSFIRSRLPGGLVLRPVRLALDHDGCRAAARLAPDPQSEMKSATRVALATSVPGSGRLGNSARLAAQVQADLIGTRSARGLHRKLRVVRLAFSRSRQQLSPSSA